MSFDLRRVIVVSSPIRPPIDNMAWRAILGGELTHTSPIGRGATEAEAVGDLYKKIAFREAKAEVMQ